ncbi:sodium channel protein Nach [Drosophila serrata]|uniref:sodium channel protein Nach n=1 Tax=Drosophila serrata TaxID=7274 RepID=UPI000A1D293A|nr:sodium channel protein Nach [Drosophila serrata]
MAFKKRRIFDLRQVQAQQLASKASSSHRRSNPSSEHHSLHPLKPDRHLRRIREWFSENMRNYCQTTSLHGFSYITRQDISRRERNFWLVVVILAIVTSIVLVVVSWYWSQETPTVTVIESSHFPTWNIPFPAVTICNFNKISKTKAFTLLQQMQLPAGVNKSELHNLFNLTLLPMDNLISNSSLQIYDRILALNNLTLTGLTQQLSPDCIDMISNCIWKGINTRCDSLFQRIDTMEGQCCTFNYFGGITNNFPEKIAYQVPKRPYRVTGCGYPTGLSVLLNPMVSDYYGTFFSGYGFRLLLHDAYNFPDENSETKVVTSTRESFVRINPESTYATSDIRRMDLSLRNCLFGSERSMHSLRRYSFINCMFECRVKMTIDLCGCLPPYVYNSNNSYKVCGVMETNCMIHSKRLFSHALANLNFSLSIVRQTDSFPCGCLPDCQSNHYVSESTMGRLDMSYFANRPAYSNATDRILLHVFFSDLMSTRYRTDIFQNWLSALASFGGLLGLIMGFSIVTAFEFLYFLTFRPIFNYINRD